MPLNVQGFPNTVISLQVMLVRGRASANIIICGDSVNFNGPLESLFRSLAFMEIRSLLLYGVRQDAE